MGLTYDESIDYLENLYRLPYMPYSQVGLRRAAFLLEQIGNPHHRFRSVHVAGSTGKGSTTTMIGSILQSAGFTTGYFRSPHLARYTERIAVDGQEISPARWADAFKRVYPIAEGMRENRFPGYDMGRPTLFELLFALGALHFAGAGVEWAAMETGIGGRLDATNLLESDVAVITNISLEHTKMLGDTVAAIAAEKAAIIKPGSYAVTAAHHPDAIAVIERRAEKVGSPLIRVGRDVRLRSEQTDGGFRVTLCSGREVLTVAPRMAGGFQAMNAATAYGAAVALRHRGIPLDSDAVCRGLEGAVLPGRFEIARQDPLILLDGAHNPAGIEALVTSLCQAGLDNIMLLFTAMADKDIERMAAEIAPLVRGVIVTLVPGSDRAAPLERMCDAFARQGIVAVAHQDVTAALADAAERAGKGPLVVAGSLYLVGAVRELLSAVAAR